MGHLTSNRCWGLIHVLLLTNLMLSHWIILFSSYSSVHNPIYISMGGVHLYWCHLIGTILALQHTNNDYLCLTRCFDDISANVEYYDGSSPICWILGISLNITLVTIGATPIFQIIYGGINALLLDVWAIIETKGSSMFSRKAWSLCLYSYSEELYFQ